MYKLRKNPWLYMKADLTARREDDLLSYANEQVNQIGYSDNKIIKYVYADANCYWPLS